MKEDKRYYINHTSNYDNDFTVKAVIDKDTVDIYMNHLYLVLHKDYAKALAEAILGALEQTKTPFDALDEEASANAR